MTLNPNTRLFVALFLPVLAIGAANVVDEEGTAHWAYRKPGRPPLPAVTDSRWPRNAIDYFIMARLDKEGLRPSPEADRPALIRRVSLDLIGLPPTISEVDAFVNDPATDAYEKVVERLLASPRYGERWARPWLDAARYADTNGYEKDRPRSMWLWRNWVINALNADMPFDQFTVEQMAGDLLPNATVDQKIATGFHRNTMLNDEGGIDAEEFRVVAVKDRVDATATIWLGTTLDCAQCHNHKFDPFSQREYYQFYAFLNHTADSGVGNGPEMPVPTPAERQRTDRLKSEIAELEKTRESLGARLPQAQALWESQVGDRQPAEPTLPKPLFHHLQPINLPDGNNTCIDVGDVAGFERTNTFSYGGWVKPDSQTGCVISRIDDPQAYRGYDLFLNDGRFEVHLVHSWPENGLKVATKKTFAAGTWHHVMVTYDGSSKAAGVRIFVDGKEEPLNSEKDALTDTIRTLVSLKLGRRHVAGPWTGSLRDIRIYDRKLTAEHVAGLAAKHPALEILAVARDKRTPQQEAELAAYYRSIDPALSDVRDKISQRRADLEGIRPATTMVLTELPKPRDNFIMQRGNFNQRGKPVEPETPTVLHPFPKEALRNRLGLARWLVDDANPLTARVTVNRHWQALFGHGFVQTPEDFGSQGEKPTHPELLDWLAVELMSQNWSIKALHRLIVTSATYRQSSKLSAELLRRDPQNELYARGARIRVEYETVRDLALAAGGLLSNKIGGPSVMPPQPPGIWENSFGFYDLPDFRWKEAAGDDRYRRGIYIFLRRTAMYPTFVMFDAPGRDICSVKRPRTNTPLQALTTLNDPVFVEAAAGLARRIMTEEAGSVEDKVRFAFRVCTSRAPEVKETERLVRLYQSALSRFSADPKATALMATNAASDVPAADAAPFAAWMIVANTLLNMDEAVTKG